MDFYRFNRENGFRKALDLIIQIMVTISFAWFCVYLFGSRISSSTRSMQPVLNIGETALLNRMSYKIFAPDRYDIVVFKSGDGRENIKRIIGLPGETVLIESGRVYINGSVPENEEFAYASLAGLAEHEILLAEDEYFVLGDDRKLSEDSRFESIGNVRREDIIGKLWFRVAPVTRLGPLLKN